MTRPVLALVASACLAVAQHTTEPPATVQHGSAHAEAAVEHGEAHEEAPMPNEIWWKWANFAILAAGLGFLISKNAGPFFRSRTEHIQSGIREAAAVRAEAEARASEIEKRISNLNAEVESLRQKSREEIAHEGERVSAQTAQQIAKIQRQAEADIAAAAKNASQELKAYSAELAINMAAQQLQTSMTQESQDQLTDAFVTDMRRRAALN
jgi:F-type H+-transporting ATPase subunit b